MANESSGGDGSCGSCSGEGELNGYACNDCEGTGVEPVVCSRCGGEHEDCSDPERDEQPSDLDGVRW